MNLKTIDIIDGLSFNRYLLHFGMRYAMYQGKGQEVKDSEKK